MKEELAGYEAIKQQVEEIIDVFHNQDEYAREGIRLPKGVIFTGNPGNGKTAFARYLIEKANRPAFLVKTQEMGSCQNSDIREAYQKARAATPSIVFIDELDTLLENAPGSLVSTLLGEIDGYESNEGVLTIACAMSTRKIPDALLRPGRFDRLIRLSCPEKEDRKAILVSRLKKETLSQELNEDYLATITANFSCAEIVTLCNEMLLLRHNRHHEQIERDDAEEAVNRIRRISHSFFHFDEESLKSIAAHEAGHLLVMLYYPERFQPYRAEIGVDRDTEGFVYCNYLKDGQNDNLEGYLRDVQVNLGGLAAQEVVFGKIYDGGSEDLDKAKIHLRNAITREGLLGAEYLRPETLDNSCDTFYLSEEAKRKIERKIQELVTDSYEKAKEILIANKPILMDLYQLLLKKRKIYPEDFMKYHLVQSLTEKKDGVLTAYADTKR
jgi:ATP-dependent Zn protease